MAKKRVLITDGVHPSLPQILESKGFLIDYYSTISLEEVHEIISGYHGMIVNSKIIFDKKLLDEATNLKWVGRLGSGLDIFDLEYAKEKNIAIVNSPEGNRNAVGEHALAMLLALANNLIRLDAEVRALHWDREGGRGWELNGKTVGLVGFGHTGQSFAKKLSGMGVDILAYDKYNPAREDHFPIVKNVSLKEIQEKADIISFHLPLTPETHHFANLDFFENCKEGFVLINTSRGKCVDTSALVRVLDNEKCRGACLDVFENEKLGSFSEKESLFYKRFFQRSDVIISPHVAGWTHESKRRMAEILIQKLILKELIPED